MIELEYEPVQHNKPIASIKVIGIGGAGGNTINSIIQSGYQGVEFITVNTDAQALELSHAKHKIQIGVKSTKGLGTGANPEIGKRAAEEDIDKVIEQVGNADIVFLAAGMGGGTGSGALPIIARALREKNILTIAIITKPFLFEGKRRINTALQAIKAVEQSVDTLVIIPNQKLLELVDKNVSMIDGFAMINDVLSQSIRGISDIITKPGHINVDFADVRTIMKERGLAIMGTGRASGAHRAQEAALQAITSPLLESMNVSGASGVLLNITGGKNLSLHEISEAASIIYEQAQDDANIIIGSVIDETLNDVDTVIVTIIATGFANQCVEVPKQKTQETHNQETHKSVTQESQLLDSHRQAPHYQNNHETVSQQQNGYAAAAHYQNSHETVSQQQNNHAATPHYQNSHAAASQQHNGYEAAAHYQSSHVAVSQQQNNYQSISEESPKGHVQATGIDHTPLSYTTAHTTPAFIHNVSAPTHNTSAFTHATSTPTHNTSAFTHNASASAHNASAISHYQSNASVSVDNAAQIAHNMAHAIYGALHTSSINETAHLQAPFNKSDALFHGTMETQHSAAVHGAASTVSTHMDQPLKTDTSPAAQIDQQDLDIPAFLRKK